MSAGVQTQRQRSRSTRRLLLDTTVACLAELGYAGTTGPAVAARAGLSRGAQLHHFGTRDQMLVAAVEHLAEQRLDAVRRRMTERLPETESAPNNLDSSARETALRALQLLAEAMSGPLYGASFELWAAARTNADLRAQLVPAEGRVRAELEVLCRTWITTDPLLIRLTLDLLHGQGVSGMLEPRTTNRQRQILERWIDLIHANGACS